MGWTHVHKERGITASQFLKKEFSERNEYRIWEVLDVAIVGLRTAYMAIKRTTPVSVDVIAYVCLLDYRNNDYYNFGYKDMDESCQPFYYDCPKRILDLLTPTDNANALEWRKTCLERLADKKAKPKLKTGMWLWLENPVTFTSGDVLQTFYISDAKRRQFRKHGQGNVNYRLPKRILDLGFKVLTLDEVKQHVLDKCKITQ